MEKELRKQLEYEHSIADKNNELLHLCNEWLGCKIDGKSLVDYFAWKGYKSIAIYGASMLGKSLLKELSNSEIKVMYFIDNKLKRDISGVHIYNGEQELPPVDVIVVTPFVYYDAIKKQNESRVNCPIVSLEEIVLTVKYELYL